MVADSELSNAAVAGSFSEADRAEIRARTSGRESWLTMDLASPSRMTAFTTAFPSPSLSAAFRSAEAVFSTLSGKAKSGAAGFSPRPVNGISNIAVSSNARLKFSIFITNILGLRIYPDGIYSGK